jgi:hypothetical protein
MGWSIRARGPQVRKHRDRQDHLRRVRRCPADQGTVEGLFRILRQSEAMPWLLRIYEIWVEGGVPPQVLPGFDDLRISQNRPLP